jgi:YidC/Oxa1 family membrane protein insertase
VANQVAHRANSGVFPHWFSAIGLGFDSGLSWVLSIVGLVLVVRAALIPVFVRQIKSQRNMMLVQPELMKLQKKYKGKNDRESREKFAREQMDLYKRTGSSPFSSCLPLLLQMPIFMGLFFVLNDAQRNNAGVGLLDANLRSPSRRPRSLAPCSQTPSSVATPSTSRSLPES